MVEILLLHGQDILEKLVRIHRWDDGIHSGHSATRHGYGTGRPLVVMVIGQSK